MTQVHAGSAISDDSRELPDNWKVEATTFGARLLLIRWQMSWNLKEAAAACELPAQSWRNWEVDGATPRDIVAVARRISARTRCDYMWLLFGDEADQTGAAA